MNSPVLVLIHQPERNGRRIRFISMGDWHFGHFLKPECIS